MVAPLVAAAGRTALGAEERQKAKKEARSLQTIRRSEDQNRNRVQRAKEFRQTGSVMRSARATDGSEQIREEENTELQKAQTRANRLRFLRAQTILAPQAESEYQVEAKKKEKPSLLRYSPAFAIAMLKDGLDYILIGSIPVIGTIVSFICAALLFLALIFAKKTGSLSDIKFVVKRFLIVLVVFAIEGFAFGVNFFPFEIVAVIIVYFMDKRLNNAQLKVLQNLAGGFRKKAL